MQQTLFKGQDFGLTSTFLVIFATCVLAFLAANSPGQAEEAESLPPLDKNNGTWHLQFQGLFGSGVKGNSFHEEPRHVPNL